MSTTAFAPVDRELVLDRYRPLRPIGRGGSGSVWLARDERSGREVALKIVPREGKRAARATREVEAASRLRHKRCVRAYDFGGDAGHVYIAYEYVQGSTLRELLRQGKVDDQDAVEICAQVLEALAHAHREGIVHRDVKPSNVIVEDGVEISTRLLDFGLAQFDEADTLTNVGDVPGTLAYIAPERLRGGEATARSDVWAVGVMLWEALAGEHPFWGVALPRVAGAIEGGPAHISTKRRDLSRRLMAALDRALSLDPQKRPEPLWLAEELRAAIGDHRDRPQRVAPTKRRARAAAPRPVRVVERVPPGLAAVQALWAAGAAAVGATLLPFWTPGLVALLAISAGAAMIRAPRLAVAIVLFAPLFPLGNLARGAALLWAAFALLWLAFSWRRPRAGLTFTSGPLLAAAGLLPLLPVVALLIRTPVRRALQVVAGVFAAALVAGVHGDALPVVGGRVPSLGIEGAERLTDVLNALVTFAATTTDLVAIALVLALTAVLLPTARRNGRVAVTALVAGQLALGVAATDGVEMLRLAPGTVLLGALLLAPAVWARLRASGTREAVEVAPATATADEAAEAA
ncbi:MAG: serine/threonine-protein kinase [Gaiella sp.]